MVATRRSACRIGFDSKGLRRILTHRAEIALGSGVIVYVAALVIDAVCAGVVVDRRNPREIGG